MRNVNSDDEVIPFESNRLMVGFAEFGLLVAGVGCFGLFPASAAQKALLYEVSIEVPAVTVDAQRALDKPLLLQRDVIAFVERNKTNLGNE